MSFDILAFGSNIQILTWDSGDVRISEDKHACILQIKYTLKYILNKFYFDTKMVRVISFLPTFVPIKFTCHLWSYQGIESIVDTFKP